MFLGFETKFTNIHWTLCSSTEPPEALSAQYNSSYSVNSSLLSALDSGVKSSMTGRGGGGGGRRVLLPPINFIFKLLQTHAVVQIWLYEQLGIRIEGKIRVRATIIIALSVTITKERIRDLMNL